MLDAKSMLASMPIIKSKKKKTKAVRPKGSIRPSEKTLNKLISILKKNGPTTSQNIQCLMDITKPFMFNCAKYLLEDGLILKSFPEGRGPGKQVYYSLIEEK